MPGSVTGSAQVLCRAEPAIDGMRSEDSAMVRVGGTGWSYTGAGSGACGRLQRLPVRCLLGDAANCVYSAPAMRLPG